MSLDDIIKQTKKSGSAKNVTRNVVKKNRNPVNRIRKNISKKAPIPKKRINNRIAAAGKNSSMIMRKKRNQISAKINQTLLTKRATANLVKNLVKKALAQSTVPRRGPVFRGLNKRQNQLTTRARGAVRNISRRSRVIARARQPRMITLPPVSRDRVRGPITYTPVLETIPAVRRIRYIPQRMGLNNYVARNNRNRAPNNRPVRTIRQQINALRFRQGNTRNYQRQPAQAYNQRNQQPIQRRQQFYRQTNKQQGGNSSFYEPANFLQRIPAIQNIGNPRIVRY